MEDNDDCGTGTANTQGTKQGDPMEAAIRRTAAEGCCRHLAKDRIELLRVPWWTYGSQSMVDSRLVFFDANWETFQQHRIEEKTHNSLSYKELIESKWNTAA